MLILEFLIRAGGLAVLLVIGVLIYRRIRPTRSTAPVADTVPLPAVDPNPTLRVEYERIYAHGRPPAHIDTDTWHRLCEAVAGLAAALDRPLPEWRTRQLAEQFADRVPALTLFPAERGLVIDATPTLELQAVGR